ncbi:cytochrome c biogenesis protein [Novosphingobium nitrogenifigens DSM 19370]|jgi:thiol-disulfide isomerase/thioredoxin|uniref:Cytochrome c biogenesis protein n=1 Tax=Novosphingobium nitrogenifigens DSM 19370 TaxID=983920 RepID=F1Z6L9_9SPHN|nr:thioredoxin family protein [Novosphingobium nitrogenifigens]EGD59679.1 cytochrome c biogenesis protein [Novosphingobium nitrogenifigens DSM 19370]
MAALLLTMLGGALAVSCLTILLVTGDRRLRRGRRSALGGAVLGGLAGVGAMGAVVGAIAGSLLGSAPALASQGEVPSLDVGGTWINSAPLSRQDLRGKVVLVDFWTYSCINCLHTLPYLKAWQDKYGKDGLVIVGVHAPEFDFEKDLGNVRRAIARFDITYPVVTDNDYRIWNSFSNRYWPAHYFVDAQGRIRHSHFGEGDYDQSEKVIQQLLAEAHPGKAYGGFVVQPGRRP